MNKRIALWMTVLGCLTAWTVLAVDASPASLNALQDLFSKKQGSAVVIGVTGTYPILDYTYYDYDPETFVVDMADVDVTRLPKVLKVDSGGVASVKVEAVTQNRGRALAKLEIHKAYLAKCIVSTEGTNLLVRVVGAGDAPEPMPQAQPTSAASVPPADAPPAATVPPPVASSVLPRPPATKLTGISVSDDGSSVLIYTDGQARYDFFPMSSPDRIVVDLAGISKGTVPNQVAGAGDVSKVRVSLLKDSPMITRVVVDLKGKPSAWQVKGDGNPVIVQFGDQAKPQLAENVPTTPVQAPAPAPQAAQPAQTAQAAQPPTQDTPPPAQAADVRPEPPASVTPSAEPQAAPVQVAENHSSEAAAPKKYVTTTGPSGSVTIKPIKENADKIKVDLSGVAPSGSQEYKGYEDLFVAQNTSAQSVEGKTIMAGGIPLSFKEKTISGGGVQYTGEPISMSLKDADVKDVLRVFHDISKLNFVVHPSVSGRVTVDLENVPWDQAMDIILKNNGLDYLYDAPVIWVAPASEIARKFSEQQRLQREKLQAEPTVTFTKRLSYAKASSMSDVASRFLSEKGSIIVDGRTNTMIIQEVPSRKDALVKLIDSLDTATPQVLIEARIVETNISWDQSFGIIWSGNWYSGSDGAGGISTTHGGTSGSGPGGSYTLHNFNHNGTGWPNMGTGDFAVNLPPSASNGFIDLVLGNTTGSFFLDVRLAAMENAGRGRILSAPRIVTQDNEKASIESGRQIPIRVATSDKISVIFVNATLKLDVTPQISADGNVNMTVDITNDSVDFAHQDPGNPPPILKKEAKTVLKVRDGATAVIGGVFVTNEGISQNGLPFLSKIPVLGWLFKNRTKNRSNDELLIFLTPKIVR